MHRALAVALLVSSSAVPARALCRFVGADDALEALGDRVAPTRLVVFVDVVRDGETLVATSANDVVTFTPVATGQGHFRLEGERDLLPDTEYVMCGGLPEICVP